jgi:hypothetical protein
VRTKKAGMCNLRLRFSGRKNQTLPSTTFRQYKLIPVLTGANIKKIEEYVTCMICALHTWNSKRV